MTATEICNLIDNDLISFIHKIFIVIKIGVPILLIIFGMLDIAKGVVASKEDEIKKGQQTFIKRLVAAILVFFVVTIVQLVMNFASPDDGSFWTCANQILNGVTNKKAIDNTTIKSDSSVSCSTPQYYSEYKKCIEATSEDVQYCATYFQGVCSSVKNGPVFSYDTNASYTPVSGVSCSFTDGSSADVLDKVVYFIGKDALDSNSAKCSDVASCAKLSLSSGWWLWLDQRCKVK